MVTSARFSGRRFSSSELHLIREVVESCDGLSRMELAGTVCELLDWKTQRKVESAGVQGVSRTSGRRRWPRASGETVRRQAGRDKNPNTTHRAWGAG